MAFRCASREPDEDWATVREAIAGELLECGLPRRFAFRRTVLRGGFGVADDQEVEKVLVELRMLLTVQSSIPFLDPLDGLIVNRSQRSFSHIL